MSLSRHNIFSNIPLINYIWRAVSEMYECAKYWADKGDKVLYITHEPMQNLPQSIGAPRNAQNLENFSLIHFMYLPSWQDLLKHCYSIYFQNNPVSVIIVQELENYCFGEKIESHDHVSLVCASLLHAASVCTVKNSKEAYLINGFNSKNYSLPRIISKNFFQNIWTLSVDVDETNGVKQKLIKLTNLSPGRQNDVKVFVFSENNEFLDFESAFETINRVYDGKRTLKKNEKNP